MASVSTADIKRLREATGAGMTDVKKALVEADGDYDKAIEQLRIKGLKGVAKREGRAASNGLVIAKLDRLSRDAHFLLGLQKAGVKFVAADMPEANEMVVGIMALVAQAERRMISSQKQMNGERPGSLPGVAA